MRDVMAKTPSPDAPIPTWLREARESQRRVDGEPWSQDDFVEALEAATGWALHRPNYSNYERGAATPKPATLRRLVDFWASRGVEAPDFDAPPPVVPAPPDLATAILALTAELAEARKERAEFAGKLARIEAVLDVLAPQAMRDAGAPVARHSTAGS